MDFLIVLLILVAVVFVLTGPLRVASRRAEPEAELPELEAAREAKYREIRDAQLDHATGKLSAEDFTAVEDRLRAEALPILDGIERLTSREPGDRPPE